MKERKPIQVLRERRGGVPKDLLAKNREQKKLFEELAKSFPNAKIPEGLCKDKSDKNRYKFD